MSLESVNRGRLFLGTFTSACDSQHRVTMPKAWRLASDTEDTRFFLIPGHNRRIHLVTEEQMGRVMEDLMEGASVADEGRMDTYTDLGSKIQQVTVDKQGRFQINGLLSEFAGLNDKAVFLGSMIYGTILAQENWKEQSSPKESSWEMLQKIQAESSARNRKA